MRTIRIWMATIYVATPLLLGLAGCGGDNVARQVAAMNTSNIKRVANMYSAFQNYKGGSGPTDDAEFKAFIKAFDPAKLSMMGIDANNLDALFTSERDSKPFFIRYKLGGGKGSEAAVVFEQDGKDGKKQVAFTGNSKVEDVDDATYAQLRAGKAPAAKEGRPSSGRPAEAPTGPDK